MSLEKLTTDLYAPLIEGLQRGELLMDTGLWKCTYGWEAGELVLLVDKTDQVRAVDNSLLGTPNEYGQRHLEECVTANRGSTFPHTLGVQYNGRLSFNAPFFNIYELTQRMRPDYQPPRPAQPPTPPVLSARQQEIVNSLIAFLKKGDAGSIGFFDLREPQPPSETREDPFTTLLKLLYP